MTALLKGNTVEIPRFNFVDGRREYKGDYMRLGPDDVLVIEGIHGLNDKLSYALPKMNKFKIYISALTQLNVDEHNRFQRLTDVCCGALSETTGRGDFCSGDHCDVEFRKKGRGAVYLSVPGRGGYHL